MAGNARKDKSDGIPSVTRKRFVKRVTSRSFMAALSSCHIGSDSFAAGQYRVDGPAILFCGFEHVQMKDLQKLHASDV